MNAYQNEIYENQIVNICYKRIKKCFCKDFNNKLKNTMKFLVKVISTINAIYM